MLLPLCSASLPAPDPGTRQWTGGAGAAFWKVLPAVLRDTLRQEMLTSVTLWRVLVGSANSLGPLSWQLKLEASPSALQAEA